MVRIKRLLLISGAIGSGKTSVARILHCSYCFSSLSSGDYLRTLPNTGDPRSRDQLQKLGDQLDIETEFSWVVDRVSLPAMNCVPNKENWLFDAVRKHGQIECFRARFNSAVRHIHLTTPENVLRDRYESRKQLIDASYDEVIEHPNERAARSLSQIADCTFDTGVYSLSQVVEKSLNLWEGRGHA